MRQPSLARIPQKWIRTAQPFHAPAVQASSRQGRRDLQVPVSAREVRPARIENRPFEQA
jgi:hypothetical protein